MKPFTILTLCMSLTTVVLAAPPRLQQGTPSIVKAELTKHKGKVVIINFWATWCGPCKSEFPDMVAISKKKGVDLITIAIDDKSDAAKAVKFLSENGVTKYAFINKEGSEFDPDYLKLLTAKSMGLGEHASIAIPLTFIYSKTGKFVKHAVGAQSEAEFAKLIEAGTKAK